MQPLEGQDRFEANGWEFLTERGPILNSSEQEQWSRQLQMDKLPGMVFGRNRLTVHHQSTGFAVQFSADDALRGVGPPDPSLQIRAAADWEDRIRKSSIPRLRSSRDWTFSTNYSGTCQGPAIPVEDDDAAEIDLRLCRRTDLPILYFQELVLFEDELDDNGVSVMSLRMRVMPSFFLILVRFWLRVDGIAVRSIETRWFHIFGQGQVIREQVHKCASSQIVAEVRPRTTSYH
mmetsp:Transcript_15910/g.31941  ORF Transcript_15910/g.31941 Transcript_15910/m.31941 type:complete len:233 (+) Transcript_15910:937-1635(+)